MSKKLAIAMFGQKRLSREGGVEIVVKELCTRMAQNGCDVTCYNRAGHHVSGAEYDDAGKTEYEGIRQKAVPTIERRGLAAVSSSFFAALCSAFGRYDVVHIHAEGPAFFAWLPKMFGKRVVVTVHGECEIIWATREKPDFMRVCSSFTIHLSYFIAQQQACIQIAATIYTQACPRTSLFCFLLYQLSLWWVKYRAQPEAINP